VFSASVRFRPTLKLTRIIAILASSISQLCASLHASTPGGPQPGARFPLLIGVRMCGDGIGLRVIDGVVYFDLRLSR